MNDLTVPKPAAVSAVAASDSQRAIAEVQAALFIASQRPRNMVAVLDKVANAFARPGLAEVAEYAYARGGNDISGPTIKAAEAIAQLYQNVVYGFRVLSTEYGDDGIAVSEVESFCWDMENNVRQTRQFRVKHWRDTKQGGYALKDERDIYELIANMAQRRTRACILSVLPGDIIESALAQAAVTLKANADVSPVGQKALVEAFAPFGVTQEQIETRIQRRMNAIQPAQVVQLKRIYASIRDGMSAPESWFEQGATDEAEPKRKSEAKPIQAPQLGTPPPTGEVTIPRSPVHYAGQVSEVPNLVDSLRTAAVIQRAAERIPGEDDDAEPPSRPVTAGQAAWLQRKAKELKRDLGPILAASGLTDASQLTEAQFHAIKSALV